MNDLQAIMPYWPLILGFIALVAWSIRLEAKVMYQEKELAAHKVGVAANIAEHKAEAIQRDTSIWTKIDSLQTNMIAVLQSLAKIEGKLEAGKDQ